MIGIATMSYLSSAGYFISNMKIIGDGIYSGWVTTKGYKISYGPDYPWSIQFVCHADEPNNVANVFTNQQARNLLNKAIRDAINENIAEELKAIQTADTAPILGN